MGDIVKELGAIAKCRRCNCLSCGRDLAGELHGHICTDGEHCVETRDRLRKFRYAAAVVAGKAHQEIIKLRDALADNLAARSGPRGVTHALSDFRKGDRVRKRKGSSWQGRVCGYYSTALTPKGYCVESEREPGSVQIYPEAALERVPDGE